MAVPVSTYRLQIRPSFDLDAAAATVPYLVELGVSALYLSPLLRATSGSDHGYDVVDPSLVDPARGGAEALVRLSAASHTAGLDVIVDIVPNHMGVAVPRENPWWWDVLRLGRASRYAEAFDIDWAFGGGRVRLPILGGELDEVIGELRIDGDRLRYFDHELPLAPGSLDGIEVSGGAVDADALRAVLDRQHYELRCWRDEARGLNYRRFFAVTTLAGVRVEVPRVFDEAHAEILRWVREGLVDGLRVDHPDGLVDPGAYLDRLAAATAAAAGGAPAPVWVEKILEHAASDHAEALPPAWATVGTTGYDAMAEIDRVLVDPAGERGLAALDARLRADSGLPASQGWHALIHGTKRMIADTIQQSEVRRIVRALPSSVGLDDDLAADALAELLACFPTYRSYLPAGAERLAQAAAAASVSRPDLAEAVAALVPLLADPSLEVARRFQQTTGPVMAKGVEDTAFYRFTRLGTLTEVGGDPSVFALPVEGLHAAFAGRQASWPLSLVALSTHDTKRGEDVRARLSVLAELPERWASVLADLREVASTGHGPFDALLWQAIIGSWPATPERLHAYAEKAAREAGECTSWLAPDAAFEDRMHAVVDAAFGAARPIVAAFVDEIAGFGWSNSLSAKLLQLAGPGVPDVYQGSELWETSLVDPDNRRPVDFALRRRMLRALDEGFTRGELPPVDASGAAKLLLVSRALRLRREHPGLFGRYRPLEVVGAASDHAIAFDRGGAIAVATRLPVGLSARGWGDAAVLLPAGQWRDELTGRSFDGGAVPLARLLESYPVALLARAAG